MHIELTNDEIKDIQVALNRSLHTLNKKRKALGYEHHTARTIGPEKYWSGRQKLVHRIEALQTLVGKLEKGKTAPETCGGQEEAIPAHDESFLLVIATWESEGGLYD